MVLKGADAFRSLDFHFRLSTILSSKAVPESKITVGFYVTTARLSSDPRSIVILHFIRLFAFAFNLSELRPF